MTFFYAFNQSPPRELAYVKCFNKTFRNHIREENNTTLPNDLKLDLSELFAVIGRLCSGLAYVTYKITQTNRLFLIRFGFHNVDVVTPRTLSEFRSAGSELTWKMFRDQILEREACRTDLLHFFSLE